MKKRIKVLITCVGGSLIYDIIKAVRQANDYIPEIIGVDSNPEANGRLLCDYFYRVANAENNPKEWLKNIFEIFNEHKFNLIFSLSEGESYCIAKNIKLFKSKKIDATVADFEFVKLTTDKFKLMSFLKKNDLHVGSFHKVNSFHDAERALESLDYPKKKVVFKPRNGRGSRGILICDAKKKKFRFAFKNRLSGTGDFESIKKELAKSRLTLKNYLVLPYYKNDISDVDCISANGLLTDIVIRLRQWKNPLSSTSTGNIINMDKKIIEYVKKICLTLKIHGPCDFDIVKDDLGNPVLLDAGSRFSGSVGCSPASGYNIISQMIRLYLKIPMKKYKVKDNVPLRPFVTMVEIPRGNKNFLL
tara:strand:+ start:617 stop:1696 length:1080 start_codon:yes stop_codon:yes gene_type:complete